MSISLRAVPSSLGRCQHKKKKTHPLVAGRSFFMLSILFQVFRQSFPPLLQALAKILNSHPLRVVRDAAHPLILRTCPFVPSGIGYSQLLRLWRRIHHIPAPLIKLPIVVLLQVSVFGIVRVFPVVRPNTLVFAIFAAVHLVALTQTESLFAARADSNLLGGT